MCSAPFGPQPLVASGRAGSGVLVCIHEADFTCRACGIRSPLASIDCEGQAECLGCGLRQVFDVVQWGDALTFAHGVGDLSGPNLALSVWREGPITKTRCGTCNDLASYALPPNVTRAYGALSGVLSAEQRTDRPAAKLGRTQAGVESLVCPQCGAAISAGGGAELVQCNYCRVALRVPAALARQQRQGAPPKMDPFWVLLEGPSVGRQRLARGQSEDPADEGVRAPVPVAPHAGPTNASKVVVIVMVAVVLFLVLGAVLAGVIVWMSVS